MLLCWHKIIHLLPLETNLFVGVLVRVLSKMQSETTIVPWSMLETMLVLGKYHCRDIHEWQGGSCSFHPLTKCSCKKCEADVDGFYAELKCSGEEYHSAHILRCEFHALAYEIECSERAKDESTFSVLTKFRTKDTNLHMKHYHAETNLGLL